MNKNIQLIVRADDAGSSWSSNMGCLLACTNGIAKSVEVMMPCAWVAHAAGLFNEQPNIDIGIHLTLTSEWESVKWRPLTYVPSLVDENGYFLPLVLPRQGDDRPCLAEADWSIDEIAREFRAQIASGTKVFSGASHISSHMLKHFKDLDPRLGEVIADLCKEYRLKDDAFGHGLLRFEGYQHLPRDAEKRTVTFKKQLSELAPGTYIFIDHPAVGSPELEVTGHEGYWDVALDRMSCLGALTNPMLQRSIHELGIELISYRDL